MPRSATLFAGLLTTLGVSTAQVPHGSSVLGIISNVAPSQGLFLANRAGAVTPVTGLVAAGGPSPNVNAVALDPIDDRIWIASHTSNQLNWIRITGTAVTQFVQHATIPMTGATGINAIVFDDNGNPIVCGGDGPSSGVFRIDRENGGVGVRIGRVAGPGLHNALTRDAAGNLYVGMFILFGQVHVMLANADGTYQPPVLFGTIPDNSISGMDFAPSDGVSPDELWISTFSLVGGEQLFRMPVLPGGIGGAVGVGVAPTFAFDGNWVDYDRNANDLLVLTGFGPDQLVRIDRTTGLDTLVGSIQNGNVGVSASSDANDAPFAATTIAPMLLNGAVGPFDLEISTAAPPGSLALVGTVAPFVHVFAIGVVGVDGRLAVKIPDLTTGGPLVSGSFQFLAAYLDPAGHLVLGAPLAWPR